jgi:Cupin-like domain
MELIDCISELDYSAFNKCYFNKKPVVYRNAVINTKPYNTWSMEYLRSLVGSRMVKVSHSKRGVFTISEDGDIEHIQMQFEKAMELFAIGHQKNETWYLQETSMFEYFPELLAEMEIPALNSKSDQIERINFWMGGKGCLTQLHFDGDHNFLVQIRGKKELILFRPEDSAYLYPKEGGINTHESSVELDHIDYDRFPLVRNASAFSCTLQQGDVLYLPPRWWHQVRTVELSISVNYWWNRFDIVEGMDFEDIEVTKLCAMIQSFMDKGVDIDHRDEEGELLIIKAIRKGYANVVEAFLLMGANPNSVSNTCIHGTSALALARENGNNEIIDLLLSYGANDELSNTGIKTSSA